ncbi:hypothetical protein AWM70_01775 [Paenibacillus yonginensis]|uniref:Major facilitator superfamily (MFS) profile domain-containing protein n=1 Tax=Paenibacillus yonginensis TaxID=1462996 RepID=A0A1B1MWE7_9BACL|nr:MFS transporter [Paenibacillus yonginensis]ANS73467.1 hypothetical protein AWM70_01775 [Paenibacillus yonginensis]
MKAVNTPMRLLYTRTNYTRLFLSGLVNGIGDRFSQVAMLSLILNLTGSGMAVGLTMGIRFLPFLLFAPLGGRMADKLSRKKMMIAADLMRVPVALSFLLVHTERDLWIIYAASFLLAVGEAIYGPVRKSSIPLLVKKEELMTVNSLEQVLLGFVLVVGAMMGGVVSLWLGPDWSFALNACSFLLTALLILQMDFTPVERGTLQDNRTDASARVQDVRRSMRFTLWKLLAVSLPLQVAAGFELLVPLFNGLDNVLLSVYAIQVFHAGDLGVGLLYGAIGIGLVLSMFVSRFAGKHMIAGALIGLLAEGLLLMVISTVPALVYAFVLFSALSFASGFGSACLDTVLMREIPSEQRGTVFGLLSAVGSVLLGMSMMAAGWLLEFVEPRVLGRFGGAAYTGIAVLLALYFAAGTWYLRNKRTEAAAQRDK